MSSQSKPEIRREIRRRRRALSLEQQMQAADRLGLRLRRLNLFAPGRKLAFYFASDGEIDLGPAMRLARKAKSRCYVPVIPRPTQRRLMFAEVGASLVANRFGIPEPDVPASSLLYASQLDWVLAPLVAFDIRGNRLGMGGGFYDTTLESSHRCTRFKRPRVLGIAHDCQRLEHIESESWDIPLDRIVTDRQVYEFS